MNKILVTGSRGQLGSDLVVTLRQGYGENQVIESDRLPPKANQLLPYEVLDVTDRQHLQTLIEQYQIGTIYHLASLLSATGEQNSELCWKINVNGLRNILEVARTYHLKVFFPSSIAVFGPHTPKLDTPQIAVLDPSTMYGITKVTGEMLCYYYAQHFNIDVRSLRLPGIISYSAPAGGGTTDFAVEMFYAALQRRPYTCFVRPETRLPNIYMPDAIEAILGLMKADQVAIKIGSSYNLAAISFSAEELVVEIQKHLPDFTCHYVPDFRQAIADSWPSTIDDSQARADWGWRHIYELPVIVEDMLVRLNAKK
jgi:nucleoside-diphosphate-sugar epimerase